MATFRDELTALNDATISAIYENTTQDITGQVHQDHEVEQNNRVFDSLLPLRSDCYRLVRGGNAATPTSNYQALLQAYASAKLLTPYGNPLSPKNRVVVILMPGIYDFGTEHLKLDAQYVDIVGIGAKEDVVITSNTTNTGTLQKTVDDVRIENLTISNTEVGHDTPAYYGTAAFPHEVIRDVMFTDDGSGAGLGMQKDILLDGRYERCEVKTGFGFRSLSAPLVDVNGTFIDCKSGTSSFGGTRKGMHNRCHVEGSGFGPSSVTAVFRNCTATIGFSSSAGNYEGTYLYCSGGASSFGSSGVSNLSGKFIDCNAGPNSFGSFPNSTLSGDFTNCTGEYNCFGSSVGATLSGRFTNCIGVSDCFGSADNSTLSGEFANCINMFASGFGGISFSTLSGNFTNCHSGDNSFGYRGGILSGKFNRCTGGHYSFGGSTGSNYKGTVSGEFNHCKAGTFSFAVSADVTSTAIFNYCTASDSSYGGYGGTTVASGTYNHCIGGVLCFGAGLGTINNSTYRYCKSGDYSFCIGEASEFSGYAIGCEGGNHCFASGLATAIGPTASGIFIDCKAGIYSFGASTGIGGGTASGTFIRCSGGGYSFGGGGVYAKTASGYFEDCVGGTFSFAGSVNGKKSGTFVSCSIRTGEVIGGASDKGVLMPTGVMRDCEWVMTDNNEPALRISAGAKVYGGRYFSGPGAVSSIVSADGSAISATIASSIVNVQIDPLITNLLGTNVHVIEEGGGGSGGGTWGSIVGTLSDQVDLQSALNGKEATGTAAGLIAAEVTARDTAIANAVAGRDSYRGLYDASTNLFPSTGGSGVAGAVMKSDYWMISVAGTLDGDDVSPSDNIRALSDGPGQAGSLWYVDAARQTATTIEAENRATTDNSSVMTPVAGWKLADKALSASPLTGLVDTTATPALATDTPVVAIGKVQGQINGLTGTLWARMTLNQTGAAAPVITGRVGNIATVVAARTATGEYTLTITGGTLTSNKTHVIASYGLASPLGQVRSGRATGTVVGIKTYNSAGAAADDMLVDTTITIHVEP